MTNRQRSCERKLLHTTYIEALSHAACVPNNQTVVVYPCDYCGGHHVGHSMIIRKITRTESRIVTAKELIRSAGTDLDVVQRNRHRIRDLERHLAKLKKLLPAPDSELDLAA